MNQPSWRQKSQHVAHGQRNRHGGSSYAAKNSMVFGPNKTKYAGKGSMAREEHEWYTHTHTHTHTGLAAPF